MSDNAEALGTAQSGEGDAVAAPSVGQAVSDPVQGQSTPFHAWESDDGTKHVFNSPEELNDYMRQGTLRHADYTRKTQQIAEARKAYEQRLKDYEAKERAFNESYPKIMQYDRFLKEHPDIADRIAKEMKGGNSELEKLLGEKIKPLEEKLSEFEQEKARRAAEEERNRAYERVSQRYKDFDRKAIDAEIKRLEEIPEEMRLESMVELLYHAYRGKLTPGEIERRRAMAANKPRATGPTSNVNIPQGTPHSREEEMAAAIAAMEAAGGG